MTICYCDYNPAEVYWACRPIAHKTHRCDECARLIRPGERYERVHAKWDGQLATYRTCVYCLGLRDLVESRLSCFCWEHGNMVEQACLAVSEVAHEVPGLAMAAGRWIVEGKRDRNP